MSKFIGDIARRTYGINESDNELLLTPRSKFRFSVNINHIDSATLNAESPSLKTIDTPFTRIRSIDMPSHDVSASTLNQYNRKRIIQTGVEYKPVTMVVYDTLDGHVEKFLRNYNNYYYSNTMSTTSRESYNDDIVNDSFVAGSSFAGYKLRADKNYIKTITIVRENSLTDTNIITIYNPFIVGIDADTLDYSASEPVEYRITFNFEGYDITTTDKPVPQEFDDADDEVVYTPPPPPPVREPGNFDDLIGTPVADLSPDTYNAVADTGDYFEDQQGLLQKFGPVFGVR